MTSQANYEKSVYAKTARTNARGEGARAAAAPQPHRRPPAAQAPPAPWQPFHRRCLPRLSVPAAEIIMFDDVVVVYKFLGDLMFFVTGDQDENEVRRGAAAFCWAARRPAVVLQSTCLLGCCCLCCMTGCSRSRGCTACLPGALWLPWLQEGALPALALVPAHCSGRPHAAAAPASPSERPPAHSCLCFAQVVLYSVLQAFYESISLLLR